MAFLDENCTLDVLTADILAECQPFECGDKDMDEFLPKMLCAIPIIEWVSRIASEQTTTRNPSSLVSP